MSPYVYNAVVVSVHDGDTISLDVDLGFNVWVRSDPGVSYRLRGCNARELSEPGGVEAGDHLRALLPVGLVVKIATVKPDKFGGRYDVDVALPNGDDLVLLLIAQQWAAAWNGTGLKPVPPWPRTVTP